MSKKIISVIMAGLLGLAMTANAGIVEDIRDGMLIETALTKAVTVDGIAIDKAVELAVTAYPEMAEDIVMIAIGLLNTLPPSACSADDCADLITEAAILAGADPVKVTEAAAAGLTGGVGGPGVPVGPGDGNRGGNISPSTGTVFTPSE